MPKALTLAEKKQRALKVKEEPSETGTLETVVRVEGQPEVKRTRKKRSTFNGTEGKLSMSRPHIPGYHLHILNDINGRIQQALDNGYEFVTSEEVGGASNSNVTNRNTDLGDKVRFQVGHDDKGSPLYGYVMKIPEDWYAEDQKAIQDRNDKIDHAIRQGKVTADGQSSDGFYTPKGGISMKN